MKLVPLADKVVVKRLEAKDKTPGGIVLPDSAKDKPVQGKVLSVGDGRIMDNGERVPVCVKEGQTVLFGRYAGNEVEVEDEKYLILSEADILAIVQ